MDSLVKMIVASPPGYSRDNLIAILRTLSQIEVLITIDRLESILDVSDKKMPDLFLIDAGHFDPSIYNVVKLLKEKSIETRVLMLVGDFRDMRAALAANVDWVQTRNVPASEMLSSIRSFIENSQTAQASIH